MYPVTDHSGWDKRQATLICTSSLMGSESESSQRSHFMRQLESRSVKPKAIDTIKGLQWGLIQPHTTPRSYF